jgi:hypothetical protein
MTTEVLLFDKNMAHLPYPSNTLDPNPKNVRWVREDTWDCQTVWATEGALDRLMQKDMLERPAVAWLIEPRWFAAEHYDEAVAMRGRLRAIVTFDVELLTNLACARLGVWGGSWIRRGDWDLYEKHKDVSIIASQNRTAPGHMLQHDCVRLVPPADVYGRGYRPMDYKLPALAGYRYTIVVMSERRDYYISEKLIDAFATGTIPLFWGCPSIGDLFNADGIIAFETVEDLEKILPTLGPEHYEERMSAIQDNFHTAWNYRNVEDTYYGYHRDLFE